MITKKNKTKKNTPYWNNHFVFVGRQIGGFQFHVSECSRRIDVSPKPPFCDSLL